MPSGFASCGSGTLTSFPKHIRRPSNWQAPTESNRASRIWSLARQPWNIGTYKHRAWCLAISDRSQLSRRTHWAAPRIELFPRWLTAHWRCHTSSPGQARKTTAYDPSSHSRLTAGSVSVGRLCCHYCITVWGLTRESRVISRVLPPVIAIRGNWLLAQ